MILLIPLIILLIIVIQAWVISQLLIYHLKKMDQSNSIDWSEYKLVIQFVVGGFWFVAGIAFFIYCLSNWDFQL
jgi:hypothetical protein